MCELNLQRNSLVFMSTVNLDGGAAVTSMTPTNTWRVEVLAGYAFSQDAATQDITPSESGTTPDRSIQRFNTAINPAEWSLSTYLKPIRALRTSGGTNQAETGNVKPLADWFMWQALMSNASFASGTAENSAWQDGGKWENQERAAAANTAAHKSNINSMQEYNLYIKTDNIVYQIKQASVNEAAVDAAIDGIATTAWSGFGTTIKELTGTPRNNAIAVFGGINNSGATIAANSNTNATATAAYHPWASANVVGSATDITASSIINRLSTINVVSSASGLPITYTFPVTNLGWTYNNNVTYLTPEELATLNSPIGQFTGARTITGTFTAYLRSGGGASSEFLRNIISNTQTSTAAGSSANLQVGGLTAPYVAFYHPKVSFNFPTHQIEDIISISAEFLAQQSAGDCSGDEVTIFVGA